jgi:hypothetical protein
VLAAMGSKRQQLEETASRATGLNRDEQTTHSAGAGRRSPSGRPGHC